MLARTFRSPRANASDAVAELRAGFGKWESIFVNLTNQTVRADPIDRARKPHDVFGTMI
jgi:hypothetical protein